MAFWAQFQVPEHLQLLNSEMKQLAEIFCAARSVMQDLCINLWSTELMPTGFFGLVSRL